MFRTLHNQVRLVLKVQPLSPILIKAAGSGLDPTRPEMEFVTIHTDLGRVEYLPGSSLKGVMRSFTERLLATLGKRVCDPLEKKSSCAERDHRAYGRQCDVCKLYGSPNIAGRVRIVDGLPWRPGASDADKKDGRDQLRREIRANVAIDRASGASSTKGLFDMDVLVSGSLFPEITLRNFQIWQLALVWMALRELTDGYQQIGSGKSRGLGRVVCAVDTIDLRQFGPLANADELRGIGAAPDQAKSHHLQDGDILPLPEGLPRLSAGPISQVHFDRDQGTRLLDALLDSEPLKRYLEGNR